MTKRFTFGVLLALVASLALIAAGCGGGSKKSSSGGGGGKGVTALPASSCSPVEYKGNGKADYLIASDLPLIGGSRTQTVQMNKAIAYVLDQQKWKAGSKKIAFQSCNDATAQLAKWDPTKCSANAHAYAGDRRIMPPPGAWFSTGISIAAQPELNVPITPIKLLSDAYAWAFALHFVGSHFASWAVASLHAWNAILYLPAFQSCWLST